MQLVRGNISDSEIEVRGLKIEKSGCLFGMFRRAPRKYDTPFENQHSVLLDAVYTNVGGLGPSPRFSGRTSQEHLETPATPSLQILKRTFPQKLRLFLEPFPNGQTLEKLPQTPDKLRSQPTSLRHEVHSGSANPLNFPPTDVDHHACSRRCPAAFSVLSIEKCVGCYEAAAATRTRSRPIVPNGRGAACSAASAPLALTEAAPGAGGLVRSGE